MSSLCPCAAAVRASLTARGWQRAAARSALTRSTTWSAAVGAALTVGGGGDAVDVVGAEVVGGRVVGVAVVVGVVVVGGWVVAVVVVLGRVVVTGSGGSSKADADGRVRPAAVTLSSSSDAEPTTPSATTGARQAAVMTMS